MEELSLGAKIRKDTGKGKVKGLRRDGFIPAIIYGMERRPQSIYVSRSDLLKLIHEHHIEAALINLKIKDEEKKVKGYDCIIKELQYDPIKGDIIHVDFNQVSLTKALKVNVPVSAKGEPIGVKQDNGMLDHILWEVEVECLPKDIPEKIEIDVSGLKINDVIQVKNLQAPSGVKILNDPEAIVFSVAPPVKEEVVVPAEEEAAPTEPEVIKEKKPEPGEEKEEEGQPKPKEEKKEETKEKTKG